MLQCVMWHCGEAMNAKACFGMHRDDIDEELRYVRGARVTGPGTCVHEVIPFTATPGLALLETEFVENCVKKARPINPRFVRRLLQ